MRDALLGSICVQSVDNARDDSPGDCGCSNSSSAEQSENIHDAELNMGTKKAPPSGRALEVRRRCYALAVAKRVT